LFLDWTDSLTVLSDAHDIAPDVRQNLTLRGIEVVDGRIAQIGHSGDHGAVILLDNGSKVAVDILFASPRSKPSVSLHEALGLATVDTPTGIALKTDERRETSIPGIYAAGDLANPAMPSVTASTWQGAMAGIFAQQSMLA
jgi:thioredoxin reductase